MATTPTVPTGYTLEEAEAQIATLTGLVDRLAEAVTLADGPVPNVPAASGCVLYSAAGNLDYEGFDGNEYATGRLTLIGPATNTAITSATPVGVSGMTFAVQAGVYRMTAKAGYNQGGGAFGASWLLSCPAMNYAALVVNYYEAGVGSSTGSAWSTASASPLTVTSPPFPSPSTFFLDLDMVVSFSAAGTCNVQAAEGTTGHSFTLLANSFIDIMPVS
jgi:hypothetical protein